MWSYRFYDRFWSPSLPFSFSFFDIVSFGSRVCAAQNADDKIVWMRATNDFIFFFLLVRSLSYPDTKRPRNQLSGELISFCAEVSLSLPVPAFYCIYFMLVLPVLMQWTMGSSIWGTNKGRSTNEPEKFRSLRRNCYCERISNFLNY